MEIETTLPEDLLINEILLRLPLKSVARFKCVSRHWQTVISDRRFVKTVLERYPEPNSTLLCLSKGVMISPRHNGTDDVSFDIFEMHPLSSELRLEGTYHGLVFFSTLAGSFACVWNPLMRQMRYFNFKTHHCVGSRSTSFFGFGFDAINDDYKAVKISGTADSVVIEIYQLKNSEAREIVLPLAQVPFKFSYTTPVTVDGSSHWINWISFEE